jgi:uncharacterized damage-inducible protein DinB
MACDEISGPLFALPRWLALMLIERLRRLLRYDIWANRETLGSLQSGAPQRSLRWMGHIIGAEYIWLSRLENRPAELAVWPDLSIEECHRRLRELSGRLMETLSAGPERLGETVAYTNSKGQPWTSTVEDILTHLTIHSAYHRGQIASDLRAAGYEPAYTDYIHAVRQGLIR